MIFLINQRNSRRGTTKTHHAITQVELTNLKTTAYTLDGIRFHTDPAALINGEYLIATDVNGKTWKTLVGLGHMDTMKPIDVGLSFDRASFSLVCDAATVFTLGASLLGKGGATAVKVVGNAGYADTAINATWSTASNWDDLSNLDIRYPESC